MLQKSTAMFTGNNVTGAFTVVVKLIWDLTFVKC